MSEGLIRVREFADECGCTPQNIYLHLKNYAAELEGHTHKGRRGILLDPYAQDLIREAMYPKELSTDNSVQKLQEEVAELRSALFQASQQGMELSAKLATTEGERDRALLDAGQYQKLLAASTQEKEAKEKELEDAVRKAEAWKKYAADLEAYDAMSKWQRWRQKVTKPVPPTVPELQED